MTPADVAQQLGFSRLHRAAGRGDLAQVRRCLDDGDDVDAVTTDGWRPLFVAALAGHASVVHALLAHGASAAPLVPVPPAPAWSTMTLAEVACRSGDAATVRVVGGAIGAARWRRRDGAA